LQGDAFSDNVNLTARIESLTRFFQVSLIISAETLARLESPSRYAIRPLGLVQVKGRHKPISLYDVFDADPPEIRAAKQKTLPDYEAAIKAYRLGHFTEAIPLFERVLQKFPADHASTLFLERARQYHQHGAPADWEGVEVMESK
jgi:adenylate cyclase